MAELAWDDTTADAERDPVTDAPQIHRTVSVGSRTVEYDPLLGSLNKFSSIREHHSPINDLVVSIASEISAIEPTEDVVPDARKASIVSNFMFSQNNSISSRTVSSASTPLPNNAMDGDRLHHMSIDDVFLSDPIAEAIAEAGEEGWDIKFKGDSTTDSVPIQLELSDDFKFDHTNSISSRSVASACSPIFIKSMSDEREHHISIDSLHLSPIAEAGASTTDSVPIQLEVSDFKFDHTDSISSRSVASACSPIFIKSMSDEREHHISIDSLQLPIKEAEKELDTSLENNSSIPAASQAELLGSHSVDATTSAPRVMSHLEKMHLDKAKREEEKNYYYACELADHQTRVEDVLTEVITEDGWVDIGIRRVATETETSAVVPRSSFMSANQTAHASVDLNASSAIFVPQSGDILVAVGSANTLGLTTAAATALLERESSKNNGVVELVFMRSATTLTYYVLEQLARTAVLLTETSMVGSTGKVCPAAVAVFSDLRNAVHCSALPYTTREPKSGSTESYHFVTRAEFVALFEAGRFSYNPSISYSNYWNYIPSF